MWVDQLERLQERRDVEREPMIADPAVDRHAHRTDPRLPEEDARFVAPSGGHQIELGEDGDQDAVQSVQELLDIQPRPSERQDDIADQLPGQVHDAPAPAVDPADAEPAGAEFVVIEEDMGSTPRAADADRRRVLAEDQGTAARPIPVTKIVDQTPLELLDLVEVDRTEQIDFQRRAGMRRRVGLEDRVHRGGRPFGCGGMRRTPDPIGHQCGRPSIRPFNPEAAGATRGPISRSRSSWAASGHARPRWYRPGSR